MTILLWISSLALAQLLMRFLNLTKKTAEIENLFLCNYLSPTDNKQFPSIADITKERVRRVIKKLNDEEAGQLPMNVKQDRGFRVFKLAESNFKTWDASASKDGKTLEKQLELHIEHIREGRTSEIFCTKSCSRAALHSLRPSRKK